MNNWQRKDIKALTAHIDLYPTFCDLAGTEITDDIQEIEGRTLLPLFENTEKMWDDDRMLFINSGRWDKGKKPQRDARWAVRSQKWRLVGNKLYNIVNDPKESTNVAEQYPDVVKKLRDS